MSYLFVYGSLLSEIDNEMSKFLRKHADYIGKGYFHGKLFMVDDYPAAVLSQDPASKVDGEIYEVLDDIQVFSVLDEYEETGAGFPEPQEYDRKYISIYGTSGNMLMCWVYIYKLPAYGRLPIPNGNYLDFLKKHD